MEGLISKVVRNTLSTFALKFVTILAGFVAIPVLITHIGSEGYGLVVLAGTISGYLALLGGGVPAGTTKFVAEFNARKDELGLVRVINTAIVFFTVVGLVAGGVLALFIALGGLSIFEITAAKEAEAQTVLLIAAGFAPLLWPANALSSALEGLQHHHKRNVASGVTTLLLHGGSIAAAMAGMGVIGVFLVQQGAILLRVLWFLVLVRRVAPAWKPMSVRFHAPTLKLILSISLWMLLSQIALLLSYRSDHFLLGGFVTVGAIATYDIVMRPFHFIREMVVYFNAAVMPAVSAVQVTDGQAGVLRIAYTGSAYSNAFGAPFAIIGIYLCGPFLQLWIGPELAQYAWLAQIACLTRLVVQTNGLVGQVCFGAGKVAPLALIAVFVALLNVGLSIWWVQEWGIAGVVLATVASFSLSIPLQYVFIFKLIDVKRWRFLRDSVLKPIAPHVILGVLFIPFWDHFQGIDSWKWLLIAAFGLSAIFFPFTWFAVEPAHRRWVRDKILSKLGRRVASPAPTSTVSNDPGTLEGP